MAETFRDLWQIVALHAPTAPIPLVQHWCQNAYEDLCGRRHWSFLRVDSFINTLASRAVTVSFVQGATAITSAAAFVASDAGRQIRLGTGGSGNPAYTIDTVTDPSNAVLTQAYAGDDAPLASATISDIYLIMPANFRSFNVVRDPTIQRPIAWWISKDRLDLFDPGRIASDTRFRVLVAAGLSRATATNGRVTYEAWPYPTAAGTYIMQYFKKAPKLTDDDSFEGPLSDWTSALQTAALAAAAAWPGTPTQKNPYFSLALAKKLDADAQFALKQADIADDDIYLMDLQQVDLAKFGLASISADTTLLRATDATMADYYSG